MASTEAVGRLVRSVFSVDSGEVSMPNSDDDNDDDDEEDEEVGVDGWGVIETLEVSVNQKTKYKKLEPSN